MRTYVCTSERTCERQCECTSVRLYSHSPRARARTFENNVDLSRPYFCTTLPFFTFLVLWRFARTEIRSIRVDLIFVRARARPVNVQTHVRAHVRPLVRKRPFTRSLTRALVRSLVLLTFVTTSVSHSYPRSSRLLEHKSIAYESFKKAKNDMGYCGMDSSIGSPFDGIMR